MAFVVLLAIVVGGMWLYFKFFSKPCGCKDATTP